VLPTLSHPLTTYTKGTRAMATDIVPQRQCSLCGNWFPTTPEYFHRKGDDFTRACKVCRNAYHSTERARNLRITRDSTPEARARINKRDKQRAQDPRRKEQLRQSDRNRRKKPERKIVVKAYNLRRRAIEYQLPHSYTSEDWKRALDYFGGHCGYCGSQQGLWNPISADHFIPVTSPECTGTIPSNIIPACKSCNSSKNHRDPVEWLEWKFGECKAKRVLSRIQSYFEWLNQQ
jgi:5-methylcytosine-specific restriction endonuclease McrA